ncbi:MAG: hypothetical protein RL667_207 [Pseudomonadota bacterium]
MNPCPSNQINNPLHGITLATMLCQLIEHYGYPGLATRIPVRCFSHEPSLASSLKFLRIGQHGSAQHAGLIAQFRQV